MHCAASVQEIRHDLGFWACCAMGNTKLIGGSWRHVLHPYGPSRAVPPNTLDPSPQFDASSIEVRTTWDT